MGTLFEVRMRGDNEEHLAAVADAVLDEVLRIERLLSRFDPRSEISRINRLAAGEEVLVDREVAALLKTCFDARAWTGGAFDITATSLASGRRQPPGQAELTDASVVFDCNRRRIRFTMPGTQLDLGGIGKGYALDCAAEILAEHDIEHALLHGGTSSVLARGHEAGKAGWRIALPSQAETVVLVNESLSCSAINEQADIIGPESRMPVADRKGVTVVAATATAAEVLSTALLCMKPEVARQFIREKVVRSYWFDYLAVAKGTLIAANHC